MSYWIALYLQFSYIPETKLWNDEPIMTLGERLVNGSGPFHFYIPADVAIEPDTRRRVWQPASR